MNKLFKTLPLKTQNEIKSVLSAYSECTVEKNDQGVYKVMACTVIHNGVYSELIGKFTKNDIFTPEEQIVNYVNSFRDYPTNYKGFKNWKELSSGWKIASMLNGNIIFK